jgi:hypothetical protein
MSDHAAQNNHPFLDADDIINDPLIIASDDPTGLNEAQTNLWKIGLSAEQARRTAPASVCDFVRAVLAQRRIPGSGDLPAASWSD